MADFFIAGTRYKDMGDGSNAEVVDIGDRAARELGVVSVPTAIYAGQTVVAATGTEVPLTTTQALQSGVIVKALTTNTGNVAVGPNPVTMTTGLLLAAGEWAFIEVADLATVYVDATVNDEGVSYAGS